MTTACSMAMGPAMAADHSFSAVKVESLNRIEPGNVLAYAGIKRGQEVSDADLNAAYQRIQNSGLFQSVTLTPEGNQLFIKVQEYPVINVINFDGNSRLKAVDLEKVIKSQSRKVYSPAQAEMDAANITQVYRNQKRYGVIVTPKIIPRSDNRVDLVFEVNEGKPTYINRISFVGNNDFSDYRLSQVLETKQAGALRGLFSDNSYDPNRTQKDIQKLTDFYQQRGYMDFRVEDVSPKLNRNRSGFFVTYSIHEGNRYAFSGATITSQVLEVDSKMLEKDIQVKAGHYYSPLAVSHTTDLMTATTTRAGLNFIKITPELKRDEQTQTASVNFVITRAPKAFVERIDIEGNSTTQDRVIRQEFRTAEGDPYKPREIQAAIDRLKATGYFKTVDVNTKPGDNPDQVIVDVHVTEQPTGSLSFGGSYAVDSGFGILLSFSEKNFLGRGQQLGLDINTSADDANSSIHFVEPHLYGRDLALSLDTNFNRTTHNYADFDSRKLSFNPGINFPIGRRSRLGLHYKIQNGKLSNIDSDASLIVKADSGSTFASMVGYDYTFNSNADGLSPDTHYELTFGQDFAGLGGNDKYIDTEASMAATTKILRQSLTLRVEIDGGALTAWGGQDTYILDRFFLNGKIIGFKTNGMGPRDTRAGGNDALGGNLYAVAKVEARFPLGLPKQYCIEGGLFANVGSVWGLDNAPGAKSEVDDSLHLRGAAGFSIFWTTPIGPLRFNFSKAFLKQSYDKTQPFNFTISTQF